MDPTTEYMSYLARLMTLKNEGALDSPELQELERRMSIIERDQPDFIAGLDKSPPAILPWVLAGHGLVSVLPSELPPPVDV